MLDCSGGWIAVIPAAFQIPFTSDDKIHYCFDKTDLESFNQRMRAMNVVAWVWFNRDKHTTFIRDFYRKFFDPKYLDTKQWGQDKDGKTKLPIVSLRSLPAFRSNSSPFFKLQEIRDWIHDYAESIQHKLPWWATNKQDFLNLIRKKISQHRSDSKRRKGSATEDVSL